MSKISTCKVICVHVTQLQLDGAIICHFFTSLLHLQNRPSVQTVPCVLKYFACSLTTHHCRFLVHFRPAKAKHDLQVLHSYSILIIATNSLQASTSMAAVNGQEHQQLAEAASAQPLLAVDPRKLRGEEEMRRIFGARTVRDEERGNANAGDQHCAAICVQVHMLRIAIP